ncbi:MAG: alpha/beta hydrolase [Gammaproteobacteria bacterium]|nr:alpha/beta hydrolase [Gammaproteobacteria bacterium]
MSGSRLRLEGKTVYVGNGSGHPDAGAASVVFVHGAGMDHTVWALPARHFARRGLRVAAVDLPGHGRSEGPAFDSINALSDWLAAVLATLDIDRAAIVGHSMGSLVAYRFAMSQPDRCRALALLGTSAPMPVTEALMNAALDNHHAAFDMANTWSHSTGTLGANANPGIWMLGAGERLLERSRPGVFHADLTACNGFDAGGDTKIGCPCLVIVGDDDLMTPARAGLDVASTLADATIVRLPGCGHAMLNERPNEVLDALIPIVTDV